MGPCAHLGYKALAQRSLKVAPTTTTYEFSGGEEGSLIVKVVFLAGVAPLANISRLAVAPNYITVSVTQRGETEVDDKDVDVYFAIGGEGVLHKGDGSTPAEWPAELGWYVWNNSNLTPNNVDYIAMQVGSTSQRPFSTPPSDRGTYPWGFLTLSATATPALHSHAVLPLQHLLSAANHSSAVRGAPAGRLPETLSPMMALHWRSALGGSSPLQFRAMLTMDMADVIQYYGLALPPLWLHEHPDGMVRSVVPAYLAEAEVIHRDCAEADEEMLRAMQDRAGPQYAALGGLAYRQVTAALTHVWHAPSQTPWTFLKEISSNGDVNTVDVIFPAAPLLLWKAPALLWSLMLPVLAYANNETWTPYTAPWAAHDLGTWPIADRDASHMEGMPIEESGNMLLLVRALQLLELEGGARVEHVSPAGALSSLGTVGASVIRRGGRDAGTLLRGGGAGKAARVASGAGYGLPRRAKPVRRACEPLCNAAAPGPFGLRRYQRVLTMWADYLVQHLPDPEDQLCTDDFKGPVRSNANLGVKGILGIAAFADVLHEWGDVDGANSLRDVALRYARRWEEMSVVMNTDGSISHYRMEVVPQHNSTSLNDASWSMKYNLFMQTYLDLNVFSNNVIAAEVAFYPSKMQRYGIPLDYLSSTFTKADWLMMIAAMSPRDVATKLVGGLLEAVETMPDRVPFTDLFDVFTGALPIGGPHFCSRPVMGCLWSMMLTDDTP